MRECGLGGRRLGSLLSDALETPDLEVTRDFLHLIFEKSPNCRSPSLPTSEAHAPPSPCPSLMSASPPGCQEGLC